MDTYTALPRTTTVHLRITWELKALIEARAASERRTFTQMAVLLLEDAVMPREDTRAPAG